MRVGLLMLVLGGCQLVFELEDDAEIEVRGTATITAPGPTTAITVPRPEALANRDLLVAIIRITPARPNTLLAPAGWVQLSEQSRSCTDGEDWRAWIVSALVTDELSFDFTVEVATDATDGHSVLAIGYRDASAVSFLAQSLPATSDVSTVLPATGTTVGSRVLLAGAASVPWTINPPTGFSLQSGFEKLAFYDRLALEADRPELAFDSPKCSRSVEIAIEP